MTRNLAPGGSAAETLKPLGWPAAADAALLAAVLTGASLPETAGRLGRSGSSISRRLAERGWPTPAQVRADPTLATRVRIELVTEHPGPPPTVAAHHHRRTAPTPPPGLRDLSEIETADLAGLPPMVRIREWARLVGIPVHRTAQVPAAVRDAFEEWAPPQVRDPVDPATERHAARVWAHQAGRRVGERGRLPQQILADFRAAGRPGIDTAALTVTAPAPGDDPPGPTPRSSRATHRRRYHPSQASAGLVVVDPGGVRHQMLVPAEPDAPATTACGLHPDDRWEALTRTDWAKAGVLRCGTCTQTRRR